MSRDHGSSRGVGPWVDGLHNRLRDRLAPLDAVAAAIPKPEVVIDLGCGQGLLLRRLPPSTRRLVGVDFDARKCRMARALLRELPQVEIHQGDVVAFLENWRDDPVDAVVLVDTLSSMPFDQQDRVLALSASVLRPGGRLVLKIVDTAPRWKAAVARGMYLLVYRGLRLSLSSGQQVYYRSSGDYRSKLESLGLKVQTDALHRTRRLPVPHVLVVGVKGA